jgi:hypothetical protein
MPEEKVTHSETIPKKSVNVWMIVAIVFILITIGIGIYGFITIRNQNNKINNLNNQLTDLQNKKKTLEDTVATAATAAAKTVTSSNQFQVKELNFSFTANPSLSGLTYMYEGANNSVRFSTSPILTALAAVPDGKGYDWQPGYLLSVNKVNKTEANYVKKDLIIADLGDSYLVNMPPQNGPDDPSFNTYYQLVSIEAPILLNSLKTAKPL